MKLILLLCAVVIGASASIAPLFDENDKLDIQAVFDNDQKRKEALACVLDRAPCGKYQILREKCPEILRNDCANCSASQKQKYQELIRKLEVEHNEEYKELVKRFKNY